MKNILIVGAGRGIGLRCAELLQNESLYTISRQATPELSQLQQTFLQADVVSDDLQGLSLPTELHGVVYCPGSINLKPFNRLSVADFESDYRQNVLGAVRVLQHCLPALKKSRNAGVVLFSSVAASVGMPFHSSIAASKAAVEGLARSLAAELASYNVRVNAVSPSLTDTPLAASLINTDEKRAASERRHPLQRLGTPDDMAHMVQFLLSEQASWITGQVYGVDGGMANIKL